MPAPLPPTVAAQASTARLGRYVDSLTPRRATSLRTIVLGLVVGGATWWGFQGSPGSGWFVRSVLMLLAVGALVLVGAGAVELLSGPGQLFLFEHGFVHVLPGGEVDAVRYGESERGEELRRRALSALSGRGRLT